jgi:hypothetical protein
VRRKAEQSFIALVMKCICPAMVLTKERIRKFSAHARAYICTSYHLSRDNEAQAKGHQIAEDPTTTLNIAKKQHLFYKEIKRLMKKFKTHRYTLDFDHHGFVKGELIEEQ